MGGSAGSQKTEQEPWGPQQPYLRHIFDAANTFFNDQQARGPWTGDFMAPEDPRTGEARNAWYEMNRQNTGYLNDATGFLQGQYGAGADQAQGFINNAANTTDNYRFAQQFVGNNSGRNFLGEINPFSNEQMRGPNQQYQNILTGGQATGNRVLDDIAAGQAPGGVLGNTLSGGFMDPNNPLIQGYLDAATRPVQENLQRNQLPGFDSAAIASGAYGGNANAVQRGQAIGDTNQAIADTRANILYQNQQAERERQQQTAMAERGYQVGGAQNERNMQFQGLTGERGIEAANYQQRQNLLQQDRNMQLQGLLQQYGLDSSNAFNLAGMEQSRNQMLAGLGTEGLNRGMQASAMMPSMFQAAQTPYQNMSQIGDMFTNSNQRQLQNAIQMWNAPSDFGWGNLGNLQGMISGNYGFTGNQQGGGGSPLMGAVGGGALGGMAGSSLASAAFMAPMIAANPWMALALPLGGAALGGGLGGLFG